MQQWQRLITIIIVIIVIIIVAEGYVKHDLGVQILVTIKSLVIHSFLDCNDFQENTNHREIAD